MIAKKRREKKKMRRRIACRSLTVAHPPTRAGQSRKASGKASKVIV
jgi:hypothetical protein